jgi:peroxiredoxin
MALSDLPVPHAGCEVDLARTAKRLTFVAEGSRMVKVFYPVFSPDRNADEVIA